MPLLRIPGRLGNPKTISISNLFVRNSDYLENQLASLASTFLGTFRRTAVAVRLRCLPFLVSRSFSTRLIGDPFELIKIRIHEEDHRTKSLVEAIETAAGSSSAMAVLDGWDVVPDEGLVHSVVWKLRQNWRLAVLGFMWGEKLNRVDDNARNLIIWILGSHGKFNSAWMMIREWQRSSVTVRMPMLLMINRYAAANNPGKALWTFNLMEKFSLSPDEESYEFLLNSLCKHGYIGEAEEFMLLSKNLFPLDVKWFNVVLNGWCNLNVDVLEAKRIWKKMASYCITPDAISYTHMISCFSKVGNLFDSLRLCDGMKRRGWAPGIEVYSALIYVLTRENCFDEALKMLDTARAQGLTPTSMTFDSMIRPLCEAGKLQEAKTALAWMEKEVTPSVETYCCFIGVGGIRELEAVLEKMKMAGVGLCGETVIMVLSKLFRLQKPEQALRIWEEMKKNGVAPCAAHYCLMAEGLSKCGLIAVAREYVAEMRLRGFAEDPKLRKLVMTSSKGNSREGNRPPRSLDRRNNGSAPGRRVL